MSPAGRGQQGGHSAGGLQREHFSWFTSAGRLIHAGKVALMASHAPTTQAGMQAGSPHAVMSPHAPTTYLFQLGALGQQHRQADVLLQEREGPAAGVGTC